MLRRTMAVGLALAVALTAGSVFAQEMCYMGVYADDSGSVGLFKPTEVQPFHIYVVMRLEDVVNAVAYGITIPDPANFFITGAVWGPSGNGVNVPSDPLDPYGTSNVGLGECAVGVGGQTVLVADYTALVTAEFVGGDVCVVPNPYRSLPDPDPTKPEYNTCTDVFKSCDIGPCLYVEGPIATESKSFGAVKALY
jgi:hypothetical protein